MVIAGSDRARGKVVRAASPLLSVEGNVGLHDDILRRNAGNRYLPATSTAMASATTSATATGVGAFTSGRPSGAYRH